MHYCEHYECTNRENIMNNIYPKRNYDYTNEEIVEFQTIIQNNDNLIKKFSDYKDQVKDIVYSAKTRDFIKGIESEIRTIPMVKGCYLGHMIKSSLRSNIIQTIINVCDRSISILERNKQDCDRSISNINSYFEIKKVREPRNNFLKTVYAYKEEYIRSMETLYQGTRLWECLVSLIESGVVTEDNISEYGIDLSTPPNR